MTQEDAVELEPLRAYLKKKAHVTEETPFGPQALVFKVAGKMFATVGWDADPLRITLKCPPEKAEVLRELYSAIGPGYHMDKRHWNTVQLDGGVPDKLLLELIDESYDLVVRGLPKRVQKELGLS